MNFQQRLQKWVTWAKTKFNPAKHYVTYNSRKTFANQVFFARFCHIQKKKPEDVAELVTLAEAAAQEGVKYCNEKDYDRTIYDKAMEAFEKKCNEMGWVCDWPGLYPSVMEKKGGYPVNLPYSYNEDED